MDFLEGISGWVIALAVVVILVGTIVGVVLAELRRKRDRPSDET